jgi:hypothetical protein
MTAKHTQKIRAMDSGVLLTAYVHNLILVVGWIIDQNFSAPQEVRQQG